MIHWTTVLLQWVSPFKVSLQRCLFCMVKVSLLDSIYVSVQCSPSPVLATPCSVWQMGAVTLQLCRGLLWLDSLYWNYFIGFFIGYFQQPRCLSELQADTRRSISLQRLWGVFFPFFCVWQNKVDFFFPRLFHVLLILNSRDDFVWGLYLLCLYLIDAQSLLCLPWSLQILGKKQFTMQLSVKWQCWLWSSGEDK